jgi:large subunit ribosomal protein L24
MHIKKDDMVVVDDRTVRGKVLRVDPRAGKVVVEGVNRVYKHVRRSQKNPQGGRLSKEMPIPISNAMLICVKCNRGRKTGARFLPDGSKERYCRKCGSSLGVIAPPRKADAARSPG